MKLALLGIWAAMNTANLQEAKCSDARVAALPLTERPMSGVRGETLVILLTGDGGFANADDELSKSLVSRGGAVIALDMRSYLRQRKTPGELASDVGCIATAYLTRWTRSSVMLLGYSRGADMVPFAARRLPKSIRERVSMVALLSPSPYANFQFHLIDLIRDVTRDDDIPVTPELAALTDLPIVCVYGRDDVNSLCPRLDSARVRIVQRPGGHRITGEFSTIVEMLAEGLRPSPARSP